MSWLTAKAMRQFFLKHPYFHYIYIFILITCHYLLSLYNRNVKSTIVFMSIVSKILQTEDMIHYSQYRGHEIVIFGRSISVGRVCRLIKTMQLLSMFLEGLSIAISPAKWNATITLNRNSICNTLIRCESAT